MRQVAAPCSGAWGEVGGTVVNVVRKRNCVMMTCSEGREIKVNGTSCADTFCPCRERDGYVEEGHYCLRVRECDKGREWFSGGEFFCSVQSYYFSCEPCVRSTLLQ